MDGGKDKFGVWAERVDNVTYRCRWCNKVRVWLLWWATMQNTSLNPIFFLVRQGQLGWQVRPAAALGHGRPQEDRRRKDGPASRAAGPGGEDCGYADENDNREGETDSEVEEAVAERGGEGEGEAAVAKEQQINQWT